MTRTPIVNGQFYPDSPSDLKGLIEKFGPKGSLKISAKGVVLPHAGYIYSGQVAVTTISEVLPKKRLLILGPNHTGNGAEFRLWERGTWKILDKEIKIDEELATAILSENGCIHKDTLAHTMEHSIEVQLPILDYFFSDFKFVPIACKKSSMKDYLEAAEQIFQSIQNM